MGTFVWLTMVTGARRGELVALRFSTGVTIATYERAGDISYGSFVLDQPTDAEVERRRQLADD